MIFNTHIYPPWSKTALNINTLKPVRDTTLLKGHCVVLIERNLNKRAVLRGK